jgi:hypothetical protein
MDALGNSRQTRPYLSIGKPTIEFLMSFSKVPKPFNQETTLRVTYDVKGMSWFWGRGISRRNALHSSHGAPS